MVTFVLIHSKVSLCLVITSFWNSFKHATATYKLLIIIHKHRLNCIMNLIILTFYLLICGVFNFWIFYEIKNCHGSVLCVGCSCFTESLYDTLCWLVLPFVTKNISAGKPYLEIWHYNSILIPLSIIILIIRFNRCSSRYFLGKELIISLMTRI